MSLGERQRWDKLFRELGTTWTLRPARSAVRTAAVAARAGYRDVLIPGIGYGRNASPFLKKGMRVTGIEVSGEAIHLAREKAGLRFPIHHGSVLHMPFDRKRYHCIYAYALLHLFGQGDRKRIIRLCYEQLRPGGRMVFVVLAKENPLYGQGSMLSADRYRLPNGVSVFFYDRATIDKEFAGCGSMKVQAIDEPVPHMPKAPPMRFWMISCLKPL